MNMDCTDYESQNCPKGKIIDRDEKQEKEEKEEKFIVLMVGCWGVYCWGENFETKTVYKYKYKNLDKFTKDEINKFDDDKILSFLEKSTDEYGQKEVIKYIKKYADENKVSALFLAGDNVYSYNDVDKKKIIEYVKSGKKITTQNITKQLSEGFTECFKNVNIRDFFIAIGNHDIETCEDLNEQLNYSDRKYNLPAVYYNVVYTIRAQEEYKINFIVIDTNMLEDDPVKCDGKTVYTDEEIKEQTRWAQNAIETVNADWNIVIGHIPAIANGHKKKQTKIENKKVINFLSNIEQKKKIQVYMCADEHNQQFLHDNNMSYVVAGSGGTTLDKEIYIDDYKNITRYVKSTFGYVAFNFNKNLLVITFIQISVSGEEQTSFTINNDGELIISTD